MARRLLLLIIILIAGLVLIIAGVYTYRNERANAAAFFEQALAQEAISTTVSVGGQSYIISKGSVASSTSSGLQLRVLQTAYAKILAERSPLLALPETDPEILERTTAQLEQITAQTTSSIKNNADAESVRTALYPIDFLHAMEALETARQTFIASGDEADERAYESLEQKALDSFGSDLARHTAAFERIIPKDAAAYQVSEGVITRDSILASLHNLENGIAATKQALAKRRDCLSGLTAACNISQLGLPVVAVPKGYEEGAAASHLPEILSLLSKATLVASFASDPVYELASSSCVGALSAPLFSLQERRFNQSDTLSPEFVGDIVFIDATHASTSYYAYFLKNGVRYAYFPIYEFYKCPDLSSETGRIFVMARVAAIAKQEPFSRLAHGEGQGALLRLEASLASPAENIVHEQDARAYLSLALEIFGNDPTLSKAVHRNLFDLALAATDNSAGFDLYVRRLLLDEVDDFGLMQHSVPVEISAQYLFYVRSAFFSLFLGTNPSVAGTQPLPIDASEPPRTPPFVYYSSLRDTVPTQEIAKDLSFFFKIHREASAVIPLK